MWLETVIKHTFYFMTTHQSNAIAKENLPIWDKTNKQTKHTTFED